MSIDTHSDGDFDPLDITRGVPDGDYARLRRDAPISRAPNGTWFLATHELVMAAVRDVETFRASFRDPGVVVPDEEMLINEIPEPRHGQVRRIVNSAVAAHRIGDIGEFVRALTHRLLDELPDAGADAGASASDLVENLVMPIPSSAIGALLGVPVGDHALFARWSDDVVLGDYPTKNRNERGEGLAGAHPEFTAYIDERIAEHKSAATPPADFITRLMQTEVDGYRLSDIELRTFLAFLMISGNETTRHMIANITHTLAADPELYEKVRADRSLIPNVVEESLRLDPPIVFLLRECMVDVEFFGEKIHAGEKVAFGIASANRDESCWEAPDEFRLNRPKPTSHLGFGGGPHVCPGSALARLEGRSYLEVLCDRVSALELEPGFEWKKVATFWANGPETLPVRCLQDAI